LTSALVPNVGVSANLPRPAEAPAPRRSTREQAEPVSVPTDQQVSMPDKNAIDTPRQPDADGAAKDFAGALKEQMQSGEVKKKQNLNPTGVEAKAASEEAELTAKQPSASQASPAAGELSEIVTDTPCAAAQGATAPIKSETGEKTQGLSTNLLGNSKVCRPAGLSAEAFRQAVAEASSAQSEKEKQPGQAALHQGEVKSEIVLPDSSDAAPVAGAGSAEGKQVAEKAVVANTPAAGQTVAKGADGKESAAKALAKDSPPADASRTSSEPTRQDIKGTGPAEQESPAPPKQGTAEIQSKPAEAGPKISAPVSEKPVGRAEADQQSEVISESPDGSGTEARYGDKNLPGDSLFEKLNPAQIQVTGSQAKSRNTATSDNSIEDQSGQLIPPDSPRVPVGQQPTGVAQASKTPANPSQSDVAASVSEQIQESIRSSLGGPEQQITIRLNPPELGRVVIKFQEQEDQLTGLLEVSKAQTRAEIQQVLPEITRNLQELGVQVKRLEVVLTGEHDRQALNGDSATSQQDNWVGRQDSSNPNGRGSGLSVNDFLVDGGAYKGITGPAELFVADESINMLA